MDNFSNAEEMQQLQQSWAAEVELNEDMQLNATEFPSSPEVAALKTKKKKKPKKKQIDIETCRSQKVFSVHLNQNCKML